MRNQSAMGFQVRGAATWLVIWVLFLHLVDLDAYGDPRRFGQNTDRPARPPVSNRYGRQGSAESSDGMHTSRKRQWEDQRGKIPVQRPTAPNLRESRSIQADTDHGGQYNRPQVPQPAPTAGVQLPSGWKSAVDGKRRTYFYHTVTKWSSWSFPDPKTMIFDRFPIKVPDGVAAALRLLAEPPENAVILEEGAEIQKQVGGARQGALVLCVGARDANEDADVTTNASQPTASIENPELPRAESSTATSSSNATVGATESSHDGVCEEVHVQSRGDGEGGDVLERNGDADKEAGGEPRAPARQSTQEERASEESTTPKDALKYSTNETARLDGESDSGSAANCSTVPAADREEGQERREDGGDPSVKKEKGDVELSWGKLLGLEEGQHLHFAGPGSARVPAQSEWWKAEDGQTIGERGESELERGMPRRRVKWNGRWWLREETVGSMTGIESVWETDEPLFPLIVLSGGPWLMQNSSFQCNVATALKAVLSGSVELRYCVVGGLDEDRRSADAIQVKDTAHASVWCCLLRFVGTVNRSLRVYGSGFCVARNCTLAEMGFAVSLDEVACVILDDCRIISPKICAFFRQFNGRGSRLQLIRTHCDGDYLWYNRDRPVLSEVECVWETKNVEDAWHEYTRKQREMMNTGVAASLGEVEAEEWQKARQAAAKKFAAAGSDGNASPTPRDGFGDQYTI